MKRLILLLAITLIVAIGIQATEPSGTLPILYINIANGAEVVEKETYLEAEYWLDPKGCAGIDALGIASAPLTTKIKGRGNWTWTGFNKKPYRLKLDKKQALLGMNKSKHFALLAHADDKRGFLRNTIGFRLSEMFGLPWTPAQRPVELVINGSYRGLYFATEQIRIDKDRVDIAEWGEEDADGKPLQQWVEGGSLVEIDNYSYDEGQVRFTDGNGWEMRLTYDKSVDPGYEPDGYTDKLLNEFQRMNTLIFGDKNSDAIWAYLDIDDTARYLLIQDILNNNEAMHGSCYMHKDLGNGQRWHYSPVWDFGSALWKDSHPCIHFWQGTGYQNHWAEELWKFPRLQRRAAEIWTNVLTNDYPSLETFATDFINQIRSAAACDLQRWPDYGNGDLDNQLAYVLRFLDQAKKWLNKSFDIKEPLVAKEFIVPEDEEGKYHVFFKQDGAATDWENVMIYWWDSGLHDYRDWPGRDCEYVVIDGNYYWHYCMTADHDSDDYHLIFNNGHSGVGENQTENLMVRRRGVYTLGMAKDTTPTEYLPVGAGANGIESIAPDEDITIEASHGAITVTSDRARTLRIATLDGKTIIHDIPAGTTTIALPSGFYIINSRKYLL